MPKTNPKGIRFTRDGGVIFHQDALDSSEGSSIRIPQVSTELGAGFGDEIADVDREFAAEREPVAHFLTYLMSADVFDKWFVIDDPSTEEGDPKIDEAVQDALTELEAKDKFTVALEYERIYGWSLLVGSFSDVSDVKDLEKPLKEGSSLVQLAAYSKPDIQVWLKDEDVNSTRFGEPVVYKIARGDGAYLYIHYTRCYRLQTRSNGNGVLDPIWDDLTCGRNIRWGASQWMYRNGGGFPVIKAPPNTSLEKLNEYADSGLFSNLMSRTYVLITAEMDFKFEGAMGRALDPTPFFHTNLEEISKGTGVPEPVLRGAQAGAVTGSEVNQRQYFKVISSIQVSLEEMVRWVIDHLARARQIKGLPYLADDKIPKKILRWVRHDVQPKPQTFKYKIEWVSAFELSELDEKQSALLHEQANQIRLQYMTVDEVRKMNELDPLNTPESSIIQKSQPFQVPFNQEGDSYLVTEVGRTLKKNDDWCASEGGHWVTIRGVPVCIHEGESVEEAFKKKTGKGFKELSKQEPSSKVKYKVEGQKDPTEERMVHSAFENINISQEDLEGLNKVIIVDEADLFDISGERTRADASYQKSTGELRIERYLLTSPELNRVLAHEVAHNKWGKLAVAQKLEWNDVYHRGLKMGYKFPSFYATTSAEEAYAECYAFYKTGQISKIDGVLINYLKNTVRD